ncbi:hypothetical protein PR048_010011 [Dryococelus australis]|uniref:Uncharacterized protein n=1 Tax=Dryococelus australis TaxID=614101 RepID=A0ABQ9I1L5_9NEOP|nr:hypothetical protein PR048_010011 [Dryococelus australis]
MAKKASCRIGIVRPRNSKPKGIQRLSVFCIYGINSVFRHYRLPFHVYTVHFRKTFRKYRDIFNSVSHLQSVFQPPPEEGSSEMGWGYSSSAMKTGNIQEYLQKGQCLPHFEVIRGGKETRHCLNHLGIHWEIFRKTTGRTAGSGNRAKVLVNASTLRTVLDSSLQGKFEAALASKMASLASKILERRLPNVLASRRLSQKETLRSIEWPIRREVRPQSLAQPFREQVCPHQRNDYAISSLYAEWKGLFNPFTVTSNCSGALLKFFSCKQSLTESRKLHQRDNAPLSYVLRWHRAEHKARWRGCGGSVVLDAGMSRGSGPVRHAARHKGGGGDRGSELVQRRLMSPVAVFPRRIPVPARSPPQPHTTPAPSHATPVMTAVMLASSANQCTESRDEPAAHPTSPQSPPSAFIYSSLHLSGFTPSHPFTPRTPRPPSSSNLPASSVLFTDVPFTALSPRRLTTGAGGCRERCNRARIRPRGPNWSVRPRGADLHATSTRRYVATSSPGEDAAAHVAVFSPAGDTYSSRWNRRWPLQTSLPGGRYLLKGHTWSASFYPGYFSPHKQKAKSALLISGKSFPVYLLLAGRLEAQWEGIHNFCALFAPSCSKDFHLIEHSAQILPPPGQAPPEEGACHFCVA